MRPLARLFGQTATVLEMIKFQHTVFALPFALTATFLAAGGWPQTRTLFWILGACVTARSAAMSFNRWSDAEIDARNPRTAGRAIPAGKLSRGFALGFALLCAGLFVLCAGMLNRLALALAPLALLVLLGYSYTKRFTSLSHFVLGLALGIAPVGAWIAVKGAFGAPAILLSLAVILWTAGFDMIYACQDVEVDRRERLHSLPSRLGVARALRLSVWLHVVCVAVLVGVGLLASLHWPYFGGVGVVAALLCWEHWLVDPHDLRNINMAFFTVNSWVGVAILVFTGMDIWLLG